MNMRDEERKFENDVYYEAWCRGLDPDRAVECASDCFWDGRSPEACVDGYQSRIERQRKPSSQEWEWER